MNQYFIVCFQWRVFFCTQCQHVVKLFNVNDHLQRQHQLFKFQIDVIKNQMFRHFIFFDASSLNFIFDLNQFISKLKIHNNEFICAMNFECNYVTLFINNMKTHCFQQHRDIRTRNSIEQYQKRWLMFSRCQQMYFNDRVNNYFRINFLQSIRNLVEFATFSMNAMIEIKQQTRVANRALNDRIHQQLKNHEKNIEMQSWLQRMNWFDYLQNLNSNKTMKLIKYFDVDDDSLIVMIWNVMQTMLT